MDVGVVDFGSRAAGAEHAARRAAVDAVVGLRVDGCHVAPPQVIDVVQGARAALALLPQQVDHLDTRGSESRRRRSIVNLKAVVLLLMILRMTLVMVLRR